MKRMLSVLVDSYVSLLLGRFPLAYIRDILLKGSLSSPAQPSLKNPSWASGVQSEGIMRQGSSAGTPHASIKICHPVS